MLHRSVIVVFPEKVRVKGEWAYEVGLLRKMYPKSIDFDTTFNTSALKSLKNAARLIRGSGCVG